MATRIPAEYHYDIRITSIDFNGDDAPTVWAEITEVTSGFVIRCSEDLTPDEVHGDHGLAAIIMGPINRMVYNLPEQVAYRKLIEDEHGPAPFAAPGFVMTPEKPER